MFRSGFWNGPEYSGRSGRNGTEFKTLVEIAMAVPVRKARTSRKALQLKSSSTNEANILAGQNSESSPASVPAVSEDAGKENHGSLSQPRSGKKKSKRAQKGK